MTGPAALETELESCLTAANMQPATVSALGGGRSGAYKFKALTTDGATFVKVAMKDQTRSVELLTRESAIMQQLPKLAAIPEYKFWFETSSAYVLVVQYVNGAHDARWTVPNASLAFKGAVNMYSAMRSVRAIAPAIGAKSGRFSAFAGIHALPRLGHLSPPHRRWIDRNLDDLRRLEEQGRIAVRGQTLMHCDLAVDNVLIDADGEAVFVDWAHAHLGDPLYDLITMSVRIRADGAWTADLESVLAEAVWGQPNHWQSLLVLVAGSFMLQSEGELASANAQLADQRLRYAGAALDWLMETL